MYLESKADFDAAIEATKNGGAPLIIDFTASWCPPCKMIGPIFEGYAGKVGDGAVLKKLDVDNNSEGAQAAGIQAMPTFKVYKDGAEAETMQGANPAGLKAMVEKYSGKSMD